eukprot:gene5157-7008_t
MATSRSSSYDHETSDSSRECGSSSNGDNDGSTDIKDNDDNGSAEKQLFSALSSNGFILTIEDIVQALRNNGPASITENNSGHNLNTYAQVVLQRLGATPGDASVNFKQFTAAMKEMDESFFDTFASIHLNSDSDQTEALEKPSCQSVKDNSGQAVIGK